jgi:hypothetical protein
LPVQKIRTTRQPSELAGDGGLSAADEQLGVGAHGTFVVAIGLRSELSGSAKRVSMEALPGAWLVAFGARSRAAVDMECGDGMVCIAKAGSGYTKKRRASLFQLLP